VHVTSHIPLAKIYHLAKPYDNGLGAKIPPLEWL
jgi:hypothetical protein